MLTNTTYDLNGLTVNVSPNTPCWRLIYENGKVKSFFLSKGKTETILTLECYENQQDGIDRITALGLSYVPTVAYSGAT